MHSHRSSAERTALQRTRPYSRTRDNVVAMLIRLMKRPVCQSRFSARIESPRINTTSNSLGTLTSDLQIDTLWIELRTNGRVSTIADS
jgi:hypothetical protein